MTDGAPVVLTSHERLDGDGVGSTLALWHALRDRGVDARHLFQPPTPAVFDFLPGMAQYCRDASELPDAYNLVVLDCGCFERVGRLASGLTGRLRTINIDHHGSNSQFGDVNWVEPGASSCAEMLYGLLCTGDALLTPAVAECLFAAIVSDTGQFSHQDTTPEAFVVCSECVRAGVRPDEVVRRLFQSLSPAQVRLQQLALATLRFHGDGRIATMEITREMFAQTGLHPADAEGFSELPISIQGVETSALLKEMPGCDYIKVSMRSRDAVDVCAVAAAYGGGGHFHAAGCEVTDTLENTRRAVVDRLLLELRSATGEAP